MSRSYVYDMPRLTDTRLSAGVPRDRDTVELGDRATMTMEARAWGWPVSVRRAAACGRVRLLMEA